MVCFVHTCVIFVQHAYFVKYTKIGVHSTIPDSVLNDILYAYFVELSFFPLVSHHNFDLRHPKIITTDIPPRFFRSNGDLRASVRSKNKKKKRFILNEFAYSSAAQRVRVTSRVRFWRFRRPIACAWWMYRQHFSWMIRALTNLSGRLPKHIHAYTLVYTRTAHTIMFNDCHTCKNKTGPIIFRRSIFTCAVFSGLERS